MINTPTQERIFLLRARDLALIKQIYDIQVREILFITKWEYKLLQ